MISEYEEGSSDAIDGSGKSGYRDLLAGATFTADCLPDGTSGRYAKHLQRSSLHEGGKASVRNMSSRGNNNVVKYSSDV